MWPRRWSTTRTSCRPRPATSSPAPPPRSPPRPPRPPRLPRPTGRPAPPRRARPPRPARRRSPASPPEPLSRVLRLRRLPLDVAAVHAQQGRLLLIGEPGVGPHGLGDRSLTVLDGRRIHHPRLHHHLLGRHVQRL